MRRHAKASAGTPTVSGLAPWSLLLVGLAAVLMLAFGAPRALAVDQTYVEVGKFGSGPGAGAGEMTHPRRLAVNETSGDVYVADRDNDRIVVFRPSGGSATFLTQFGSAVLDAPFGVAVDQSSGDVYVSSAGNDQVVKFESDGAPTPTFTVAPGFAGPAPGPGAAQIGDFEADVAVDPTGGDLLVADPGNNAIKRYDADGKFLSSFDGSSAPGGAFEGLLDVEVVAGGAVYAVDASGPLYIEGEEEGGSGPCVQNYYCGANSSRILRFDADGSNGTTAFASEGFGLFALDPTNSQLLGGSVNPQGASVAVFRADGSGPIARFGSRFAALSSIAVDAAHARVYMVNDVVYHSKFETDVGAVEITAFKPANFPTIIGGVTVSAVASTSAHLSSSVNPNGEETSVRFEYARNGEWQSTPEQSIGSGSAPVAVAADIAGLAPNAEYQVRLQATNEAGVGVTSAEVSFTTGAIAPSTTTIGAGPRTATTARLNGWVNPFNSETTYHFEFGSTTGYGTTLPAVPESVGSGEAPIAVSAPLQGLEAGATYHFRLVAENAAGTTLSPDQTFTTRTGTEPGPRRHGIELVSNPDKGNQTALPAPEGLVANDNASRIIWTTNAGAPGSTTGSRSSFIAERTSAGWRSRSMLPPAARLVDGGESSYIPRLADPGFDRFLYEISSGVETKPPVTLATMDLSFNQTVLGQAPPSGGPVRVRASDDFSHVYRNYKVPGESQLYDFTTKPPTLVSVMPNGTPADCGVTNDTGSGEWAANGYEWMTTDPGAPPRVFFESPGELPCAPSGVYMRDRTSETTTLLSGPALPGGPQGQQGIFVRASDDGSEAIFAAAPRLTADDDNDVSDIYRYRVGSGPECLTCVGPGAGLSLSNFYGRPVVVSDDLSRVYFTAPNVLVPGEGRQGAANLYLWHDGEIRYVSPGPSNMQPGFVELTGHDRLLYFASTDPEITTDETDGREQIYRYSEDEESLECVTCRAGHVPNGRLESIPGNYNGLGPTAEGGETIVFSTTDAIDPRDVNGDIDIYEWRNGRLGLVTDGVTQYPEGSDRMTLLGIGEDGQNIVFTAKVNFTGYERDDVGQFYVARVDGGFPRPPAPPAPCGEESCQGPLVSPPGMTSPASANQRGAGNVAEGGQKTRKACPKGRKPKKAKGRSKCVKKRAHDNKRGNRR